MLRSAIGRHVLSAPNPSVRCRRAAGAETKQRLKGRHRCSPTIVSKHEFVQVDLELSSADSVMSANQPVLEVADDAIGEWYDRARTFTERRSQRLLKRDVPVPSSLQASKRPEAVGIDRCASGYVRCDDARHGGRGEIRQDKEPDPARPVITLFDADQHRDRATVSQLTASSDARLRPANPRVVELDVTVEWLAGRVDHSSAKFVQHHPRGFIPAETELPLDPERRDAALIGRHQVGGPKPLRERGLGVVQHRPGRQRHLMPTLGTLPAPLRDGIRTSVRAAWTHETIRPSTCRQISLAGFFGCELLSKLVQILRKGRARHARTLHIVAC